MQLSKSRVLKSHQSLLLASILLVIGALVLFTPHNLRAANHYVEETKAEITDPVSGTAFPSSTVTFLWGPVSNNVSYYLEIGNAQGGADIYGSAVSGGSTTVSGLPTDDRILYVRLWSYISGVGQYNDYHYYTGHPYARLKSPANGSTLTAVENFSWTLVVPVPYYLSNYFLDLSSSPGSRDIYARFVSGTTTTIFGIPADGRTVYVRIWTYTDGVWYHDDRTYQTVDNRSTITSPANGSTFDSSTVTFNWGPSEFGVYYLDLSSSPGSRDIYASEVSGGSTTVSGIPTDGRTIYVRLWSLIVGVWVHKDYVYQAAGSGGSSSPAQIMSPTDGSTFTSSSVTFNWNTGTGASQYFLDLNSSPGSRDIFADYVTGGSTTVSGIPNDGRTIYVRLWSLIGSAWVYNSYTYQACSGCSGINPNISQITSPANGSTFGSSTVTFTWNPVAGATQYFLDLNSSPGSRDIFADYVTGGSTTVSGIPADGRTIYVRMWSFIGGVWLHNDYTYTATH